MSINTIMSPVRIFSPDYQGDTGARMGKTICPHPAIMQEPLTGRMIFGGNMILFWQEYSLLNSPMDLVTYNSNEFIPTKYKFHEWLYSRGLFECYLMPQQLGLELCNFVFFSNVLTDDQRRDQFAYLIFDELRCDEGFYKIAMGTYLFSSAQVWMKIEGAAERFQKVDASWDGELGSTQKTYEALAPLDQGIYFSLTETFVLKEEVIRNLCDGLISHKKIEILIDLFKENGSFDRPIDAEEYGRIISNFCYGKGKDVRVRVEVLLLGLPLLVSQNLFFETLLCQYFEKKARNSAYFESVKEASNA